MTVQFVLAPSADLASTVDAHVTVEAEYGSVVAQGSLYTAAHHQPGMEHLPAPCNDGDIPLLEEGVVLVSHLDLDSIGGCLRTVKGSTNTLFTEGHQSFWNLAHFVDVNGPHKLGQSGASEEDLLRLNSFWAWSKEFVPRFSHEEVSDVTETILKAKTALFSILKGSEEMLEKGREFMKNTAILEASTFKGSVGQVIVRETDKAKGFCNHLYTDAEGSLFKAVACHNTEWGSITISLADPIEGVSCRDVMQSLFGPEAGGHEGIAGSPREQVMTREEFERTVKEFSRVIDVALMSDYQRVPAELAKMIHQEKQGKRNA